MTSAFDDMPLTGHGLVDLAERYDLILCDVWGVIHNGIAHHRAAVDALRRFRQGGGTVVLVTNAPAPARNVLARLDSLKVPRDTFDAVATSGDVTIAMIVEAGCPPLFTIGPDWETDLCREAGRIGSRQPATVALDQAELVLGIGLSDGIGPRPEDYDAILAVMRGRDLAMICANPDIVVEVGDTLEYCAGAIAERYETIGGTVVQAGKPFAPIYQRAFGLGREIRGETPKSRILAIGDAMHTDMAGARNQGVDAVFITAGIHRAALHGPARGSALNHAVLRRFLDEWTVAPVAAMPGLAWIPG